MNEIEMYVICCAKCGAIFSIPKALDQRYRHSHQSFYCPNGHTLSYDQKTTEDVLRETVDRQGETILKLHADNRKLKTSLKKQDALKKKEAEKK